MWDSLPWIVQMALQAGSVVFMCYVVGVGFMILLAAFGWLLSLWDGD